MRTPRNYVDNLNKGYVTTEMVDDVLYSFNKRAKNWRNQARRYRQMRYNKYDNEERAEEKKEILYKKKSDILSLYLDHVVAVHKLCCKCKIRIEDTDEGYDDYLEDIRLYEKGDRENTKVVYMNSYYDRDIDDYVTFINVVVDVPEYYLYYEFPQHSYHHPIGIKELPKFQNLKIVELDELVTRGEDINDLLPLPFCDRVWNYLVNNKNKTT